LQWPTWFSKIRKGKEGERKKLITGVPLHAVGEHSPHHLGGVVKRIKSRLGM